LLYRLCPPPPRPPPKRPFRSVRVGWTSLSSLPCIFTEIIGGIFAVKPVPLCGSAARAPESGRGRGKGGWGGVRFIIDPHRVPPRPPEMGGKSSSGVGCRGARWPICHTAQGEKGVVRKTHCRAMCCIEWSLVIDPNSGNKSVLRGRMATAPRAVLPRRRLAT